MYTNVVARSYGPLAPSNRGLSVNSDRLRSPPPAPAAQIAHTIAAVSAPGAISPDGRFLFSRDGAMWDVAANQIALEGGGAGVVRRVQW